MPTPTICTCTLKVNDLLGSAYSTAELVCTPVKSFINGGELVLAQPKRATAVAGVCTLALVETTTPNQKVIFTLNYNNASLSDTIVFDPIVIPNQSTLDLSTVLTITKG